MDIHAVIGDPIPFIGIGRCHQNRSIISPAGTGIERDAFDTAFV